MRALYPFYNLLDRDDRPLFRTNDHEEIAAVVVGSDLMVNLVLENVEGEATREVVARAMDGDGNQLGVLGRFQPGNALVGLPVVVDVARRLFPNHLFTPTDGELDPRGGWTTGMVRITELLSGDIARLHGKWVYVMAVYNPQESTTVEGWDQPTRMLRDMADQGRVVHYVDDTKSRDDKPSHHFVALTEYDLVEIQTLADGPA